MATYEPTPVPAGDLRSWVARQFRRVADTLRLPSVRGVNFAVLHSPPERFEDGDMVLADGVDWNPGAGGGAYIRFGGAWVKL